MLNGRNIKTRRPSRKLDHKLHGPFRIEEVVSNTAIRLSLPKTWKIHKVFHVSLVEPFIQGNREINMDEVLKNSDPIETEEEYDVDDVMDSIEKKNGQVLYLVKWKGWPNKKDWTREPFENFNSLGSRDVLRRFHNDHPSVPKDTRLN